MQPAGSIVGEL